MAYPQALEQLNEIFRRLPGIGRRSAERLVAGVLEFDPELQREMGRLIATLPETVGHCPECGNLSEPGTPCAICADPRRDASVVCVVEDFTRIAGLEKSGGFRGVYHILGGRISPLDDVGEDNLNLAALDRRIASGTVKELILALGGGVESRATGLYLARRYQERGIRITQLAQGIPAGGDPAYADSATLAVALSERREVPVGTSL